MLQVDEDPGQPRQEEFQLAKQQAAFPRAFCMSGIRNRWGTCQQVRGSLDRPGLHLPRRMEPFLFPAWLSQLMEDTLGPLVPNLRIGLHLDGSGRRPENSDPDRTEEDALDIPASWEEVVEEMRREGALSVEEREAREAERLRLN